ncbi:hypothetical protein [Ancylobacter pratisalsi]|uniref:Uncharacterized protein n=1 Tax=Ancylobacter pratisalsi TaxID=1745854 RepID=A0A6P1YUN4_9HYPH|nr:hypothetical protein [Ancylobacter pratisalsi]QIB35803.1 hypothetical protein G3A50_20375 [Ancylobacter pratisalsi]
MLDRTPPEMQDEASGGTIADPRRASVSDTYRALVAQIHARIRRLGLPMWQCDDLSGLQDGYTAKLLHPDTPSGRQSRWETLDLLMAAIFPDGYTIIIKPNDGSRAQKLKPPSNPTVGARDRAILQKYGRLGGLKAAANRRARQATGD